MKLSACLIVKNEAENLMRSLPALLKAVDEVILVDTGSTDGTVKVAEALGARVFHFTWIDDFSAARNASLKEATGDWLIWPDADELITEDDANVLRENLQSAKADAFNLTIYESRPGLQEKSNGYHRVKVFRNGLGFHFERPINEQLVDAQGKVVKGEMIPVALYHWGKFLAEEKMKQKRENYVRLYSASLAKNPKDAYLHFLLANNLKALAQNDQALVHYDQAYGLEPESKIGRQALENKADILLRQKKLSEAAQAAQTLLAADQNNIPARNIIATIFLYSGKLDESIALLLETLSLKTGEEVANLYHDQAMPNFLLGKAYELKGDKEKAAACNAEYRRLMG